MAVGDRLALHRQLHLDAGLGLCVEDGHTHALLHARSEDGGRRHQIAPGTEQRESEEEEENNKNKKEVSG